MSTTSVFRSTLNAADMSASFFSLFFLLIFVVITLSQQELQPRCNEQGECSSDTETSPSVAAPKTFAQRVTFVAKTMGRTQCVLELLQSLKARYPDVTVLVADDGEKQITLDTSEWSGVQYFPMPVDAGLSASRNFLVDNVHTELFVLLDDDFVFTDDTQIERLLALMDAHPELDIVSGGLFTDEIEFYDYAGHPHQFFY